MIAKLITSSVFTSKALRAKHAIVLLLLATAALPKTALTAESTAPLSASRFAVSIGTHDWGGLGDLQSADGGSFQSTGMNFAAEWHWHVTDFQRSTLLVGGELGFFANDSNIQGLTSEVSSRGSYLMPSLKLAFGRQRNFYLDAGAGLYVIDFTEFRCDDSGCGEIDEIWEETQFGGYVGVSADLRISQRWAVAFAAKVHFVNFGSASGLAPESQNLNGPIYMLQVGVAF